MCFQVYVDNGRSTSSATVTFNIAGTSAVSWSVKVSQIECSSLARLVEKWVEFWEMGESTFSDDKTIYKPFE